MRHLKSNIKNVWELIEDYWAIYGGWSNVFLSPYFLFALFFTSVSFRYWGESGAWTSDVISVIPSILGFSLGGYAIFMAFSNEQFLKLIVNEDDSKSYYMALSAQFVHFILIQVIAILFALLGKQWIPQERNLELGFLILTFSGIGYLVFVYALMTAMATALSLLRFGRGFHRYQVVSKNTEKNTDG